MSHGWATPTPEARIAAHVQAWEHARRLEPPHRPEILPFVTINREFGCIALHVANKLADLLNERSEPAVLWVAYDRELIDRVAQELHLQRDVVESLDGARRSGMTELFDALLNRRVAESVIMRKQAEVIRSLAFHGHSVIVGRGSHLLTRDLKTGLHVRFVAPHEWRVERVARARNISLAEARRIVAEGEKERAQFLRTCFIQAPGDSFPYDLIIDVGRFAPAEVAEIVAAAVLTPRFGETPRRRETTAERTSADPPRWRQFR